MYIEVYPDTRERFDGFLQREHLKNDDAGVTALLLNFDQMQAASERQKGLLRQLSGY